MFNLLIRLTASAFCRTYFRLKVKGLQNLPRGNRVIITANHSSFADPVIMAAAISRPVIWIIRKDVFDVWWLKWFFTLAGMIRENGSVDKAIRVMDSGYTLGIFPEGGRSDDGRLVAGKKGIAVIALRTGVPVVPCAIIGSYEAYPRGAILPKPRRVEYVIGEPLFFDKKQSPSEAEVSAALENIMSKIRGLMEK